MTKLPRYVLYGYVSSFFKSLTECDYKCFSRDVIAEVDCTRTIEDGASFILSMSKQLLARRV